MADTSTTLFKRMGVREGEKRSPALSFTPAVDNFTLAPPLAYAGLCTPDNDAFLSPYYPAPSAGTGSRQGRAVSASARAVFGQVYSKKHMLSHAESMKVVEKPPPSSDHNSAAANMSDIYEPSGLLSFDMDDAQTTQLTGEPPKPNTVAPANELSDLFLDLGVDSPEKTAPSSTGTDTSIGPPKPSSSTTASTFDDTFSSPPPPAADSTSTDHSPDFDTSFFDSAPVTPEPAKKQSPVVKTPPPSATKKKASSGSKGSSLTPPGPSSSAAAAALAKRKKAQANAAALKPPMLSPVKKPSSSLSSPTNPSSNVKTAPSPTNPSSNVKTAPPPSSESDITKQALTPQSGFNFDDAFSSPPLLPTPPPAATVPSSEESRAVNVTLNSFEELLSVMKKGVLEKFEMSGTVRMNASCAPEAEESSRQLGHEEEVVVQLAVTDPQQHLDVVTAAPQTQECHVAVSGKQAATVKLSALPVLSTPLLAYRAAPSFRPELLRAKSVVTVSPEGTAISVSIQVMLNTKFPALLKSIHVMASLAPVVEAAGGDIQDTKSRPPSGVYNAGRRVLSWECGDHLPAKTPLLKMEALLAPPTALTNAASIPSSVPIIVKALMSTPLLVDCKVEVSSVAISSSQQPSASSSSTGIHTYKSKCEYQFL